MENNGIEYINPTVIVLQDTGLGVAEIAARTCYDSFDKSEHNVIKDMNELIQKDFLTEEEEAIDIDTQTDFLIAESIMISKNEIAR